MEVDHRAVENLTAEATSDDVISSTAQSQEQESESAGNSAREVTMTTTVPPPQLHQTRGRGRPSKLELMEREREREDQIMKMFDEKGEMYSLVLVSINHKLALQNGLTAKLGRNT